MVGRVSARRLVLGIALALVGGCGFLNGLQGNSIEADGGLPPGQTPPLTQLQWHGPEMIDHNVDVESQAPTLAWGQGAAWVAFYAFESNNNAGQAWVTRRPRGGDFATPVRVPAAPGWPGGSAYPVILVAPAGDALVATLEWILNGSSQLTSSSIWASRLNSNLDFTQGGLAQIASAGSGDIALGSVAIDAAGTALLTYSQFSSDGLFAVAQANGSAWSAPQEFDSLSSESAMSVSAGFAGTGLLGWNRFVTTSSAFESTTFASTIGFNGNGITTGPPQTLSNNLNAYVLTGMRGDQGMVVTATEGNGTITTTANSSGFWGQTQTLSENVTEYVEPNVAVNAKGEAVLLWQGQTSTNLDGYGGTLQASFWDGGSWSLPQQISGTNPNPHAWWAAVDLNDNGEAVVAWADFESSGTYTRIFTNILETSSGAPVWSGPVAIDVDEPTAGLANEPQNSRSISVALDPQGGEAQLIWIAHDADGGTGTRTYANWLEAN